MAIPPGQSIKGARGRCRPHRGALWCKMGDNDFSVEHTGVSARHRAGTLKRVVKYYKEAFTKAWDQAWDHLASRSSDGEDGQRCIFFIFCPWKRAEYGIFGADHFFFGR